MLIGKLRRTMREDEAGQALAIGAVTMLVLALAVMVTIQLGWAIDQRMKVQNAADNAAYSAAAVVARSLNFIAFVNRTAVAHYVSMMAFQSIASFLTGVQTLIWMLADLVQSLSAIACYVARACTLCIPVPIIGAACAACEKLFSAISTACEKVAKAMYELLNKSWQAVDKVDLAAAKAVEYLGLLNNRGMYYVAKAMKEATGGVLNANIANNFQEQIIKDTAGTCNTNEVGTAYKLAMGGLNGGLVGSYDKLFDEDSPKIPMDGGTETRGDPMNDADMVQNAERLMAEISNASRTGKGALKADFTFETKRGWDDDSVIGEVLEWIGFEFHGSTRLVKHMDPQEFTEDTVGFSDGQQTGEEFKKQADKCQAEQATCKQKDQEATAAANTCSASNAACSTEPPGDACANAPADCQKAADKASERDEACDKAKDSCGKLEGMGKNKPGAAADVKTDKRNNIFEAGKEATQFTRGGSLGSAEYVKATGLALISGGAGRIVGIQSWFQSSDGQASFHCRLDDSESERSTRVPTGICPDYAYTKATKCLNEGGRHKWYAIGPYLSFRPMPEDKAELFNQPDFWAFVNKSPDEARFPPDLALGFKKSGKFELDLHGHKADLNGVGKPGLSDVAPGLNGWARAMTYYHRPGHWAEPPNLFNPYWKAKLSPIGPKVASLTGKFPLPSSLSNHLSKVLTH